MLKYWINAVLLALCAGCTFTIEDTREVEESATTTEAVPTTVVKIVEVETPIVVTVPVLPATTSTTEAPTEPVDVSAVIETWNKHFADESPYHIGDCEKVYLDVRQSTYDDPDGLVHSIDRVTTKNPDEWDVAPRHGLRVATCSPQWELQPLAAE